MIYALRLIFRLKGGNETLNIVDGIITHDFALKQKKEIFTAGDIEYKDGRYYIDIKNKKQGSSAILTNMLGKTGLLIQKEDSPDLKANDKVKILLY
jgi:molybdopterin molybdotransferase